MNGIDQDDVRTKRSPAQRILRLCALGGGMAMIMGLGVCMLMLGFECLRPIPAPKHEASIGRLLRMAPKAAITHPAAGNDHPTSASSTGRPGASLHYARMIPDAPDIPAALKARATELNPRFDAVFKRIEAYAQTRRTLTPQEAARTVEQIDKDYTRAFSELWDAVGQSMTDAGGCHLILERYREYLKWYYPAAIESRERNQKWLAAAGISRQYWDFQRSEWERVQWNQNPMRPIFNSDYDRQNGYQDYHQVLYYYRRTGGMNGLVHVGELLYEQKKRELYDRWRRIRLGR